MTFDCQEEVKKESQIVQEYCIYYFKETYVLDIC